MTEREDWDEIDPVSFIEENLFAWIGNMMRDFDAQGHPIPAGLVLIALQNVANMVSGKATDEALDRLLRGEEE